LYINEQEMVEVTKLRTNYKLRYDYLKKLNEFIKSLPKDHWQVKMDPIQQPDGSIHEDWYRLISEAYIGTVLAFIKSNNISFHFTNLTDEDINKLRKDYIERQKQLNDVLKLKTKDIDTSDIDFSFMKIEPYEFQKQAVVFFDSCGGAVILGDQPGVGKTLPPIAYSIKNNLPTLIICPASLKLNWRKEILRFTNEKAFIYKWKPTKKSGKINYTKEESHFHIINFEAIENYAKFNVHHKCKNIFCGWEETNLTKRYKQCPSCQMDKMVKSKNKDLVFVEKDGITLSPEDYKVLVIDEAHYIKSTKTDRTKIVKKGIVYISWLN